MSWQASSWALELTLGDARRKMVLVAIASYADAQGRCSFASLATLAQNCDMKENALRRRIRELEEIGVINRFVRRVVPGGKIVSERVDGPVADDKGGSGGKRTSDEFWVDKDMAPADVEAEARRLFPESFDRSPPVRGEAGIVDTEKGSANSSPPQCGEAESQPPPHKPPSSPHHSGGGILHSDPKKETYPTLPKQEGLSKAIDKRFEDFKSGYPDGILDLDKAKAAFAGLTEPDQVAAVAGVAHYADRCKRRREKSIKAHLYVSRRSWEGLVASPESRPNGGPYDPKSDVGRAILVLCEIAQYSPIRTADNRIVWRREITPQLLALAQAHGNPQRLKHETGSKQFWAWASLLDRAFEGLVRRRLTEISTPWEWPPRIDGTLSPTGPSESTGPPQSLMTADDERALTDGL